ncbi:MAG: alpha/beta hydrolase [Solirubrobacteraceae bacterium]
MTLDPQVQALWAERLAAGTRPVHELTAHEARAADLDATRRGARAPEPVARVLDREIPGPSGSIPIRIYEAASPGPLPVLVYFFGGGWVIGTIEASDAVCRRVANAARCAVVAVAYRRAPEHRFPAAVADCYAATHWIAGHAGELGLDGQRLAVAGASGGGNLAAVVARLARDRGGPPLVHQLLVYPVADHLADTPSMWTRADPFFSAPDLAWAWSHYLADPADGASTLASPLRAADLSGLAPALVITAEHDPLRDEGEAYAARLAAAGVRVELTRYDGMVHGFFAMGARVAAARGAMEQAAAALRAAFTSG